MDEPVVEYTVKEIVTRVENKVDALAVDVADLKNDRANRRRNLATWQNSLLVFCAALSATAAALGATHL